MIISHQHKFIFIKTKKVGGTSLEIALSKYCGADDIITPVSPDDEEKRRALGFRGAQNYKKPVWQWGLNAEFGVALKGRNPTGFFNHISAADVRKKISKEIWESYYKFSIARNPYDTVISWYYWATAKEGQRPDFSNWLKNNTQAITDNWNIYSIDDTISVDKVVRYEHLEDDLNAVSEAIGLTENVFDVMKTIRAKSNFREKKATPASIYQGHPEAVDLVRSLGRNEISLFNYDL